MTDIDAQNAVAERNRNRDEAVFKRLAFRCGVGNSEPIPVSVRAIAKELGLTYSRTRASVRRLEASGYVELRPRAFDDHAHRNAVKIIRDLNNLPDLDDFDL